MLALLSPRGRSDEQLEQQQTQLNQLSRLLGGRQLSREDVALQLLADNATLPLNPLVVERLCFELEKRGLTTEGIFRIPGGTMASKVIFAALGHIKTGEEVDLKTEQNVHNISAALKHYLLHTAEPLIPFDRYESLLSVARRETSPIEQAAALGAAIGHLAPAKRKSIQRILKMCNECSKHADTNQMTARNLAIVFSPVLFHDESESLAKLAANQGIKMAALETLITHYNVAFPQPYEAAYKPPARPGEVPLLVERDWALMLAKAETQQHKAGAVVLDTLAPIPCLYRIRRGSVTVSHGFGHTTTLIAGDYFGERIFLGRRRSDGRFVAAEDTELWALQPAHLLLMWSIEPRLAMAFLGNVALALAGELRGQVLPGDERRSAAAVDTVRGKGLQRSTMAAGAGAALQEQLLRLESDESALSAALHEDGTTDALNNSALDAAALDAPLPAAAALATEASGAAITLCECKLGKRVGVLTVAADQLLFEARTVFGGVKRTQIPYDAIDRITTMVPDDVICGKRHASKVYNKSAGAQLHCVSLFVRKRDRRSVKQVEKRLGFFSEAEAVESFRCAARLVQTAAEDRFAGPASRKHAAAPTEDDDDDDMAAAAQKAVQKAAQQPQTPTTTTVDDANRDRVVCKAVALFDYAQGGFVFHVGELLLLTAEKKDLRVRGRLLGGGAFEWFPRNYVEPIVWLHTLKGVPTEADLAPLLAVGSKLEFEAEQTIEKEGEVTDSVFFIRAGVCRIVRGVRALGKMAQGDMFGEVSLLVGGAASASVVAHTPVTVVALKKEVLRSIFSVRVDLAAKFYKMFAAVNLRRLERNASLPMSAQEKRISYMQSSHHHAADPIPRVRDSAKLAEQLERNATANARRNSRARKSFDAAEARASSSTLL